MRQELRKGKAIILFVKLFVASAILALIAYIICDWLRSKRFSEERVLHENISININDLVLSFLSEYFFFFLVTFLILMGGRFLYFYFTHRNENKMNLI